MNLVQSSINYQEIKLSVKNSIKTFKKFFNPEKDNNRNDLINKIKGKDSLNQNEKKLDKFDKDNNKFNNLFKKKNNIINNSSSSKINNKSIINNILELSENQQKQCRKIDKYSGCNPYTNENTTLLDLHQKKVSEKELEKSYMSKDLEFLRKKTKNPFFTEVKCLKCSRPFSRSIKDEWKNLCLNCYLKKSGFLVNCQKCEKRIYILPSQINNDYKCQECYIKERGIKNNCANYFCKEKVYYRMPDNTKLIEYCEDCYLKRQARKLRCKDCNKEILIFQEKNKWESRCYDCNLTVFRLTVTHETVFDMIISIKKRFINCY